MFLPMNCSSTINILTTIMFMIYSVQSLALCKQASAWFGSRQVRRCFSHTIDEQFSTPNNDKPDTDEPTQPPLAGDSLFSAYTAYQKNEVRGGHVYYVASPIGNLGDMSPRGRRILETVDIICAEDTRHTAQLLRLLSIPASLDRSFVSHHEHNQFESIERVLQKVREGKSIAVVSDAGTPGISDPGSSLAAVLAKHGVPMHPIPGPSAVIAALSISGFPCQPFTFLGFLPVKGRDRKESLRAIHSHLASHTVVLYEAPHRILKTFADLASLSEEMGNRAVVCCREITKKYEDVRRGAVKELLLQLEGKDKRLESRGEFTVILGPMKTDAKDGYDSIDWKKLIDIADQEDVEEGEAKGENRKLVYPNGDDKKEVSSFSEGDILNQIKELLMEERKRGSSKKDAIKAVALQLSLPKKIVYRIALKLLWPRE